MSILLQDHQDFLLVGEKIQLTLFKESDIDEQYVSWLNDTEVTKYSNQRFFKHTSKSCLKYLNSFNDSNNLFLKITNKEQNEKIGTMTAYYSQFHKTVDIGIMIGNKKYWSKGIGSDAWITLINFLKTNKHIRKITAGTMSINIGMLSIFNKSNMEYEATKEKQELCEDKEVDLVYYRIFCN